MGTIFKIYAIISLLTMFFIEEYFYQYLFLIFSNFIIFRFFSTRNFMKKNIILSVFHKTFVFAYIIKLQLYLIIFSKGYDYEITLEIFYITTFLHLLITFFITFLMMFASPKYSLKFASSGIMSQREFFLINTSLIMTLITAFIYYKYSLFIMGKEMIELPFHLNGLMFFLRTIVIPIILLAVVFTTRIPRIEKYAIIVLFILGISDMILRSSKGALMYILIQMFIVIYLKRSKTGEKINYKPYIAVLFILIASFPLMKSYRESLRDERAFETGNLELDSALAVGSEAVLSRLQGFSEFYNVYSNMRNKEKTYDYEKSISQVYTFDVLNIPDFGVHLESPSLLGAGFIFFRFWGVFILPLIFILFIFIVFNLYYKVLAVSQIPAIAYSIFEVINSTIAGTVDFTFERIIVVIVFSLILDYFVFKRKNIKSIRNEYGE